MTVIKKYLFSVLEVFPRNVQGIRYLLIQSLCLGVGEIVPKTTSRFPGEGAVTHQGHLLVLPHSILLHTPGTSNYHIRRHHAFSSFIYHCFFNHREKIKDLQFFITAVIYVLLFRILLHPFLPQCFSVRTTRPSPGRPTSI